MDDRRFDAATRVVGTLQTRRGALRSVMGGLVGLAVTTRVDAAAKKSRPRANPCDVCDGQDCAFSSIQAAIDAASAGASIAVCEDTYRENINISKDVTLNGVGGEPKIKGNGSRSVVTVASGVTAVIDNFDITDGGGTSNPTGRVGGGVLVLGDLTLRNSFLEDNTAQFGGGIYVATGGRLTLDNSEVFGNKAEASSGRQEGGGIYSEPGSEVNLINGSLVKENKALIGGGIRTNGVVNVSDKSGVNDNEAKLQGGGIFNDEGLVTLDSSNVIGNEADKGGGIFNFNGTIVLQNNSAVAENKADDEGGGIYNQRPGSVELNDSAVTDNKADLGGGIFNIGGRLTLAASTVFRNHAGDTGGGIFNTQAGIVTLDAQSAVRRNDPNNCVGTLACRG